MSDAVREFEVRLSVPLETQGGEPLGVLRQSMTLAFEAADIAADGEVLDVCANVDYGGKRYLLVLPVELAWLRDPELHALSLNHPPLKVDPFEIAESVAARPDGRGGNLVVTARRYRTTTGETIADASTVRTR